MDPVSTKRELALELGATHVIDPAEQDVTSVVSGLTDGEGADVAIESAGRVELVATAFDAIRRGGTIVCVGVPAADAKIELPGPAMVRHEKIVTGSLYGSCRPRQDMPKILDLYADGRLPLDRLVTKTYDLEEINAAFEDMVPASSPAASSSSIGADELTPQPRGNYLALRGLLQPAQLG